MKKITASELRALTTDQLIALMRELSAELGVQALGPAERDEVLAILALIRAILAERRRAKPWAVPTP